MEGSAHYEGRAVDIFVRPISPANKVRGWAIAQYLVAQADRLDIKTVIFDGRIWTAGRKSGDGWRDYDPPETLRRPRDPRAPRPRARRRLLVTAPARVWRTACGSSAVGACWE